MNNYRKSDEKPPEEFYESLNSIRKISNVLNQIVVRMLDMMEQDEDTHVQPRFDCENCPEKWCQNFI